jgi:putative MFS transporter
MFGSLSDQQRRQALLVIVVAALGYFVDIYDLLLFSMLRVRSLKDLGVSDVDMLSQGALLLNSQMLGLLVGGIFWGILGDKRGRLSVLFGSIILYSLANLANGMVQTVPQYAAMRFLAGFGLAGELGAGITLVAEMLPKESRGYGTSIVAAVGILGAVVGYLVSGVAHWRVAYYIGGGLGMALLLLRIGVVESGMFKRLKSSSASRGNFGMLFSSWARFKRYAAVIIMGLPLWYLVGVLITFSPEFGRAFDIAEPINAGKAVAFCYGGLAAGDFLSGLISQWMKSRKKAVALFMTGQLWGTIAYFTLGRQSVEAFYGLCVLLGLTGGYWALFVTIGAEQFGTDIRATVTTTVPNFVRGAVPLMTLSFVALKPALGVASSGALVGLVIFVLSFVALFGLDETFHKDLDYLEQP